MAPATASTTSDAAPERRHRRSTSITTRILAINIFVIVLLVGGFLYLDSYRSRLVEERADRMAHDAAMLATALSAAEPPARNRVLLAFAQSGDSRIRLYGRDGALVADSFALAEPTYTLRDPEGQPINRRIARGLDRTLDWVVGASRPEDYAEPRIDQAQAWPEVQQAIATPGRAVTSYRFAPDRTPMIGAALASGPDRLLVTTNARDITRTVRAERLRFGLALAVVSILSILLSLFLARTIARPLRRLANAATRVRLGRARDVVVPRLPDRSDEIGTLARALSDMTGALRSRIDAGEHLAADIAHELKNPLASLRSALEGLDRVEQPELRRQLMDIANDDVWRLDRLVTDISEASRVDAELSRTRFKLVDIGQLLESIVDARRARARPGDPEIAFARPRVGAAVVMGEPLRLVRVIENLLDNAISFSPAGGVVRIGATCADEEIIIRVEDEGPGVPPDQREMIFRRFHSVRPQGEDFGKHSGLGLAIARAIVDAHQGRITAVDREGDARGACFEIRLPAVTTAIE